MCAFRDLDCGPKNKEEGVPEVVEAEEKHAPYFVRERIRVYVVLEHMVWVVGGCFRGSNKGQLGCLR